MNNTNVPVQSLKTLVISMIGAIFLAVIILVTVIGPAEFGIDPTGLGKTMGLTALAPLKQDVIAAVSCSDPDKEPDVIVLAESHQQEVKLSASIPVSDKKTDLTVLAEPGQQNMKTLVSPPKPKQEQSGDWMDVVIITVPADSGLEYKFHVQKNSELAYTWTTDGAKLYFDFHGEPAGDTTGYFKSFKETTDNRSDGVLKAPFTGIHGWYWENSTKKPIRVTLKTKGQYTVKGVM